SCAKTRSWRRSPANPDSAPCRELRLCSPDRELRWAPRTRNRRQWTSPADVRSGQEYFPGAVRLELCDSVDDERAARKSRTSRLAVAPDENKWPKSTGRAGQQGCTAFASASWERSPAFLGCSVPGGLTAHMDKAVRCWRTAAGNFCPGLCLPLRPTAEAKPP